MAQSVEILTDNITLIKEIAPPNPSRRVHDVCWQFGVPPREPPQIIAENIAVSLSPGSIILLTGPSGSGKSSLLTDIAERAGRAVWVGAATPSATRGYHRREAGRSHHAVVDRIAPRRPLPEVLEILTACGLGEPRLWVRRQSDLSDGEKFRAALARAVGSALTDNDHPPIFCDEFTAILHRRLACSIAFNLRKLVTRHRLTLVVATTHGDVADDLQPDTHIRLGSTGPRIESRRPTEQAVSLQRTACVERGSLSDYRLFAPMHYRHRDALGFVDKVFLLRDKPAGDPLGIAVFAHASPELSLRNQATANRFRRDIVRLNRELRILRRLVMHPDIRGCGMGHWFVREALPQVGTRFVECLAAMGAVNPVFERAGMTRVGRCPPPRGRIAMLERIAKWNLDPFSDNFAQRIKRCPRVRKLVLATIGDWISTTHSGADMTNKSADDLVRVFRQLIGEPPMYYLWDKEGEFPSAPPSNAAQRNAPPRPAECDDADPLRAPEARSNPTARKSARNDRRDPDARHRPDRRPDK